MGDRKRRSDTWWALFWSFRDDGDTVRSAVRWATKVERAMQEPRSESVPFDEYLAMENTADTRWHRFARNFRSKEADRG